MGGIAALADGWELARGGEEPWWPARVPGTVADALAAAGRWAPGEPEDFDEHDWVFRTRFDAPPGERAVLHLDGVATYADVELNGEVIARTESMFVPRALDVAGRLRPGANELRITCRALAPLLAARRRPRARWRTRLVDNALRWHRTMLLGRAPGIAPGPAAVGPWRPVRLETGPAEPRVRLRPRLEGDDGVLAVRTDGPVEIVLGAERARVDGEGELRIARPARWWPHTHGAPVLHDVRVGEKRRRVGFRLLEQRPEGFGLVVNGVEVFARGAVWTPGPGDPRPALALMADAGMNIVRVVGTGAYEDAFFHDACDELGLLVWQDFMFANLDYPVADEGFRALVVEEARYALAEVAGRPSLAVLCGNSEVEQQVAMLGLDPGLGRGELFDTVLPELVAEAGADVPYLPSAPCGGALPFRPDEGVAHWFGVGGYRRPIADTRRAGVRFAAECLAFSNLGEDDGIEAWAPADHGTDWTFRDVREHYVRELYGEGAGREAQRQATGEVMAEVFGEWRRPGSPCAGGIVLWLRDLRPGAGWGLLDHRGRPKPALGALRATLAPLAVWLTDEGMSGIGVHVANDGAEPVDARLRLSLYARGETLVGEAAEPLVLPAHGSLTRDAEAVLGRFADVSWAYRFGPPAQDLVVAALETPDGAPLATAFRFPVGRPATQRSADELGLEAELCEDRLRLRAARVVHGLRADRAPGRVWTLEPGRERTVPLEAPATRVVLHAVNLATAVEVPG